ncbi:MAG: MBL fold metallo-hydrolase [Anaerotardibacter sp.]
MFDFYDIGLTNEDYLLRTQEEKPPTTSLGLKLHVLVSGSKGNASIVENAQTGQGILIDCGITKKAFFEGCDQVGFDPEKLKGILITHEHSDHTKGLGVVSRGLKKKGIEVPFVTTEAIAANSKEIQELKNDNELISLKEWTSKSQGGMSIFPFATSHDSCESYGFRFEGNETALGFITDSGFVSEQAHEALSFCHILALEANHDEVMLKNGPYPYHIKQRIASNVGHLSNNQAAQELEALLWNNLEHIICMHISENNNTYQLPSQLLKEVVRRNSHAGQVQSAYQKRTVSV